MIMLGKDYVGKKLMHSMHLMHWKGVWTFEIIFLFLHMAVLSNLRNRNMISKTIDKSCKTLLWLFSHFLVLILLASLLPQESILHLVRTRPFSCNNYNDWQTLPLIIIQQLILMLPSNRVGFVWVVM